ncbi:MAG TPA: hypothetical protein VJO53_13035 [Candidatus Acidoferrales bacterium]|nr:hypothetical protein [Candidatus Acidoferrales bacterium]
MPTPTLYKTLYRILTWSSLAGLVVVLALVLRKSPAPDVSYDPAAAARVEQKFAAADQAKASGQPAQVQLDRTELNSYLAQNLQLQGSSQQRTATPSTAAPPANPAQTGESGANPLAGIPGADGATLEDVQSSVKDVKVDMDGDLVKAHVIFDFHGQDLSLELDGHLGSQDGYLKFEPVAGKLGSLPLPQSMLDSVVEKMMASPENREKLKLPDDISDIQIQNGQAVVSYK